MVELGGVGHHGVDGELLEDQFPAGGCHVGTGGGVFEEAEDGGGESVGIFRGDDEAAVAVLDGFGVAAYVGGDDGEGGGHGFDDGVGEAFAAGGEDEEVGGGEVVAEVGDSTEEVDVVGEVELLDEFEEVGVVVGLEDFAGDGEAGVGVALDDEAGGAEEDIVAFNVADVAEGGDVEGLGGWWGGGGPVGEVEAVVDGGDAVGMDSVGVDGVLADELGDGEDVVGEVGEEAVGEVVLGGAEDAHVAAAPDEPGGGGELDDEAGPEVGALEEGLDDLDALGLEEATKFKGGVEGVAIVGAGEGKLVDGAGGGGEEGAGGIREEGENGDAEPVLG